MSSMERGRGVEQSLRQVQRKKNTVDQLGLAGLQAEFGICDCRRRFGEVVRLSGHFGEVGASVSCGYGKMSSKEISRSAMKKVERSWESEKEGLRAGRSEGGSRVGRRGDVCGFGRSSDGTFGWLRLAEEIEGGRSWVMRSSAVGNEKRRSHPHLRFIMRVKARSRLSRNLWETTRTTAEFTGFFNRTRDFRLDFRRDSWIQLYGTLEMLEKKEHVLQKKITAEFEKAKDYTKLKNKKAAIQCLKKKKLYEAQIEQIGNFQLRVHDQMIMLEGAKATTDTIDALKTGSAAMKSLQKSLSVDDIDKTMEHVNEQSENMKQIQESLAASVGVAADFDEDELEAELEELEGEELEEHLKPPSAIPAVQMPVSQHPQSANGRHSSDVDELATLQAEMAL